MPLSDVRVVEIASGIPAAYCASLFADLGADVIVTRSSGGFRERSDVFAEGLRRRSIGQVADRFAAHANEVRTPPWADSSSLNEAVVELGRVLDGAALPSS